MEEDLSVPGQFDRMRKGVGLALGPLLFLAVWLLPFPGLSLQAHRLAAILALVVVWWVSEAIPIPASALLAACLAVLFGVETAKAVFAPFADPVIFLFIGSFILAKAASRHRLDLRIAFVILSLPFVGRSMKAVFLAFGVISLVLSMWISNTATTAMLLPIGLGILNTLCLVESQKGGTALSPKQLRLSSAFMLIMAYGASVGGIGTPVGSPPNLIGLGLIERLIGLKISFFQWMVFAVPMMLLMFATLFLILTVMDGPESGQMAGIGRYLKEQRQKLGSLSAGEKNTMAAFFVTVALWVLPGFLGLLGSNTQILAKAFEKHVPEAVAAVIGSSLLFLLPTDWKARKATLTWKEASDIDWGTILLFGGGLSLGQLMFSTGLAEALGQRLLSFTGAESLWGITAMAVGTGIIISELTSNTASANMVIPVMISLAKSAGVDPLPAALGACFGASFGFMLPVSTPPNAIVYGSGLIPITRMIRTGIVFDVLGFFIILLGLFLFLPLAGLK